MDTLIINRSFYKNLLRQGPFYKSFFCKRNLLTLHGIGEKINSFTLEVNDQTK